MILLIYLNRISGKNKTVFEITMAKMTKPWTGKKDSLTNPDKKQQHKERKQKKSLLHDIETLDWKQQLKEYKEHATESL